MGTYLKLLQQNWRHYLLIGILVAVCFGFLVPEIASAQSTPPATETPAPPASQAAPTSSGDTDAGAAAQGFEIYSIIYNFLISIGGLFTLIGGLLLDYTVIILVSGMGDLLTSNIGVAVDQLWVVVRDIFNIFFIFSLIALGIQTILKSNDASTQKAIGNLLIAALLINFSLLITKAIVDFSNVAAHQIVEAMAPLSDGSSGEPPQSDGEAGDFIADLYKDNKLSGSISAAFMDRMRLSSYAQDGQFAFSDEQIGMRTVIFGFLMMILMIIAGFVFAAGAVLLIARFVTLVFLLIFSPVLFLGWIYPGFSNLSKKYTDSFLKNAFVAPAYLFMLFISLRVFAALGVGGTSGLGHFSESINSSGFVGGTFILILFFSVIAGFLIASVIVAKNMGAAGSSMALKISQRGQNLARGLATAPINAGYRNSVGRMGARDARLVDEAQARIASGNGRLRDYARLTRAGVVGGGSISAGRERFEQQANSSILGGSSLRARQKQISSQAQRAATQGAILDIKDKLTRKQGQSDADYNASVQQAFADMTNGQLLEIADTREGAALIKNNAHLLTSSQLKALADSDKFNDSQVAEFASARGTQVEAQLRDQNSSLELKNASKDQLTSLGIDRLSTPEYAVRLTDDQIKNLDMVDAYKDRIKESRKAALTDIISNGNTITDYAGKTVDINELAKMKPKDIAALPDNIFNTTGSANVQSFLAQIPVSALTEIASQKNKATQANIRTYLTSIGTTNGNMRDWLVNDRVGRNFGV